MEKGKKIGVLLLTISIMMIISGVVCSFVVSLKEDQKATQARMVVVNDTFEEFNASVTGYETSRDTLYTESLSNLFYDTLAQNDAMFKEKLNNCFCICHRRMSGGIFECARKGMYGRISQNIRYLTYRMSLLTKKLLCI